MKTQITIKKVFLMGLMSFFFIAQAWAQGYGSNTSEGAFLNEKWTGCDSTIAQSWAGNAWRMVEIEGVQLNGAGLLTRARSYDSTGKLYGDLIIVRDANNRAISEITYYDSTGTRVKQDEDDFSYNSKGWVAQDIYSDQYGNIQEKDIYTYDASGNMTVDIDELFDSSTSSLMNSSLDSFFYNSSNLMVKDNRYSWTGTAYQLDDIYIDAYNPHGKIISENDNFSFIYFTYNAAGNEILDVYGYTQSGATYYQGKDTLTYDSKGALAITTSYITDSTGKWILSYRSGCASAFSAIASIKNARAFSVYPNPSRGNINIQYAGADDETANIRIVNMQGKEVYNQQIQFSAFSPTNIQTASMPEGIYFITAENDKGFYTQKLVVQK